MFSIINNLNLLNVPYEYTGLDIFVQPQIKAIFYMFFQKFHENKVNLIEVNSLKHLENCTEVFDIIMIDGDHNYKTVSKELSYLKKISHKNSLIICDDYNGRWSNKDLYYSERLKYKENKIATKKEESEKQGVGTAIDEFLEKNTEYISFFLMKGEPICITNKDNIFIETGDKID